MIGSYIHRVGFGMLFSGLGLSVNAGVDGEVSDLIETRMEVDAISQKLDDLTYEVDSAVRQIEDLIRIVQQEISMSLMKSSIEDATEPESNETEAEDLNMTTRQVINDSNESKFFSDLNDTDSSPIGLSREIQSYVDDLRLRYGRIRNEMEELNESMDAHLEPKKDAKRDRVISESSEADVSPKDREPIKREESKEEITDVIGEKDQGFAEPETTVSDPDDVISQTGVRGFYFLPFIGAGLSEDFRMSTPNGDQSIEGKNGYVFGLRAGYQQDPWFLESELSYGRNNLSGTFDVVGLPLSFSGEASTFGAVLSGGLRKEMMASLWFELGAGLGGMQQEIDYSLDVIAGDEAEVVLAYEVFGGLFYLPTDHSIVGLRYRWLGLGSMERFSSRHLHLFELSAGYRF